MKIARLEHLSLESYALINGNKLATREDVGRQLNLSLPEHLEEFLFGGWIETIRDNHVSISEPIDGYRFLPPLSYPSKIICLGYNYLDHAIERGTTPPDEPIIFMKPRTTLIGSGDSIVCPSFVTQLDYEGELAFVIGKKCKNVKPEEAMEHVLGYFIFNDVSARDIQFKESQWTKSKGFDTFAPCGPWLTTRDEIRDPYNLRIITKVNNEVRQDSSTKNMVIKIDRIVARLSMVMTLEQGDIIASGTPSGVAAFMENPKFLHNGDRVDIEIEKLGSLRNNVLIVE